MIDQFQISENVRCSLRSNNNMLMLFKPRTNAMKRSVSYKASKVWNTLPLSLKQESISVDDFKSKLKMNLDSELLVNLDY